jgi:hypothetical protein
MHEDRVSGMVLIGGTALGLITMSMHPSGADLLRSYDETVLRNTLAHGLAIAGIPATLLGLWVFTQRLRLAGAPVLASAGMSVYLVAAAAVLIAAVASGLTAPMVARRILESAGTEQETWRAFFAFNGMINQGFAAVYVVALGVAMLLWSAALWVTRMMPRALAALGLLVGIALVVLMLGGRPHLSVHTFGLIIVAVSLWMLGVGVGLISRRAPPLAPPIAP